MSSSSINPADTSSIFVGVIRRCTAGWSPWSDPRIAGHRWIVCSKRLPADSSAHVAYGHFGRFASSAPQADLNIFPLPDDELDADFLWSLRDATGASCLFTQDSGDESALA